MALRNALHAAGLTVVEQADATTIRIEGQVLLSELDAANQLVKLSWKVLAPDGAQIGLIDQSNPVATGSLSGHWGELAYAAAQGAADGVIPLLQDYQSQRASKAQE